MVSQLAGRATASRQFEVSRNQHVSNMRLMPALAQSTATTRLRYTSLALKLASELWLGRNLC